MRSILVRALRAIGRMVKEGERAEVAMQRTRKQRRRAARAVVVGASAIGRGA